MLTIEIKGEAAVMEYLTKLGPSIDPTGILDMGAAMLLNHMKTRFLGQVDPDGVPWVPSLAAQLRVKLGQGGGTLFNTGTLFRSIQLYGNDDTERLIGTDVPYGIIHQLGLAGMPKREFLGISSFDAEELVTVTRIWITKKLEEMTSGSED